MRALLLMFLPLFATAQQGWVSVAIQGDAWGRDYVVGADSSNAIVAGSAPTCKRVPLRRGVPSFAVRRLHLHHLRLLR